MNMMAFASTETLLPEWQRELPGEVAQYTSCCSKNSPP